MYAITDDGGSGGSSESPLDVYSTEETRVGTWIDGKPIYRICLEEIKSLSNGTNTFDIPLSTDVDVLTNARFVETILANSVYTIDVIYPSYGHNNYAITRAVLIKDSSNVTLRIQIADSASRSGVRNVIVLEYTKTTDTGGAS